MVLGSAILPNGHVHSTVASKTCPTMFCSSPVTDISESSGSTCLLLLQGILSCLSSEVSVVSQSGDLCHPRLTEELQSCVRLVTAIFLCCTRVEQSCCFVSKSKQ